MVDQHLTGAPSEDDANLNQANPDNDGSDGDVSLVKSPSTSSLQKLHGDPLGGASRPPTGRPVPPQQSSPVEADSRTSIRRSSSGGLEGGSRITQRAQRAMSLVSSLSPPQWRLQMRGARSSRRASTDGEVLLVGSPSGVPSTRPRSLSLWSSSSGEVACSTSDKLRMELQVLPKNSRDNRCDHISPHNHYPTTPLPSPHR